jgi:Flp pilus assembly protein TadG
MLFRRKRSVLKDDKGATAIEFAILAPLFFAFVLAIIDISAYFFVAGQLQHGVVQAARSIRTGNLIGSGATARDAFRTLVCDNIETLMISSCNVNVRVDVRAFNSFGAITLPANLDANSNNIIEDSETVTNTGGSSCPVIARAFYNYSTIVPGLENVLASLVPDNVYISAATAFRNEPFTGGTTSACTDF